MDIFTILIAFGLAMDAFSVSISSGLMSKHFRNNDALKMASFFGLFQAIMPVMGWLAGVNIIDFISGFDHWIAFALLTLIGYRMIYESIRTETRRLISSLSIGVLLMLSIATSIDALAVGLSLSLLKVSIATPAAAAGIITFLLSFFGVYLGSRCGHFQKQSGGLRRVNTSAHRDENIDRPRIFLAKSLGNSSLFTNSS